MDGLKDFLIQFDRQPPRVYFPGDAVTGKLVVNLYQQKSFKKIKVELVGKGDVRWEEERTDGDNNDYTYSFSNHEKYVEKEVHIHQGPDLPPGDYIFTFSLPLPLHLPSSFEGKYGNIRYYVRAKIERDWKTDHKVKEHIMVNSILDLNLLPAARQEGVRIEHKTLGCLCFKSEPITATLHLKRTGYVSGETLKFNVEVDNLSSSYLESIYIILKEVVTFKSTGMSKTEEREVMRVDRQEGIRGRSTEYWEGTIRLPTLAPTGLAGSCSIIDLQYRLDLHVRPPGPSFDLVVRLPFTLGSIPLQESMASLASPNSSNQGNPLPEQFKKYPDLPAPSFTESKWGASNVKQKEDDEFTRGNFKFVPRYLTYGSTI